MEDGGRGGWAGAFFGCLSHLSCDDIERSVAMNMGPLGWCMQGVGR